MSDWVLLTQEPGGIEGSYTYYRNERDMSWPHQLYVGMGGRSPDRWTSNDFDLSDSELDRLVDMRMGERRMESLAAQLASQGYFWISPGYMG